MDSHFKMKMKGHTRFSPADVIEIKAVGNLPWGHPQRDARTLAKRYGCAPETIRKMWRGETFTGTGGVVEPRPEMTDEEVDAALDLKTLGPQLEALQREVDARKVKETGNPAVDAMLDDLLGERR